MSRDKTTVESIAKLWILEAFLTMEGRQGIVSSSGGVAVVEGSDAPSDYNVVPRPGNPTQTPGSKDGPTDPPAEKKRGRPRKYSPDGSVADDAPLSPKPMSSAAPFVINFSAPKLAKLKLTGSLVKPSFEAESLGKMNIYDLCCLVSFTVYGCL